ncbi:hypothetical protein DFO77_11373 [Marinilabilia salmonicolor]|jgi:hypothetical protein|uniref:FecR family protein n=2 Tax=Marinilabilia salmonicolor TaxID=989 RepID=A0A368UWR6_9BACT|nr:hypothetical protein DFO77_11373 [Marinilabilia salmonicolor]
MKKQALTFILLALSITSFCQSNIPRDLKSFTDQFRYEEIRTNTENRANYNFIKGSPFLNKEFSEGEVTMNDSIKFQGVPLRYNIHSDKMEFMTENNLILEVDNTTASYIFNVGDKIFKNKSYHQNNQEKTGILQLLVDGKFKLYKKYTVDFEAATEAKGFQESEPNRFERKKDQYFISLPNKIPELITRKKDLIRVLEPEKPEIKKFIKDERIKTRSEEDLIKLIQHCNK